LTQRLRNIPSEVVVREIETSEVGQIAKSRGNSINNGTRTKIKDPERRKGETEPIRNWARKEEIGGIEGLQESEIGQSIHCKLRVPPPKSGSFKPRDIDPNDSTILACDANPE